jgi:hypothetical protein
MTLPIQASPMILFKEIPPVFKGMINRHSGFRIVPSYPHIPKSGINPWEDVLSDSQCMIHIRTRDHTTAEQLGSFLKRKTERIGKNHYGLIVFGDAHGRPNTCELKPS